MESQWKQTPLTSTVPRRLALGLYVLLPTTVAGVPNYFPMKTGSYVSNGDAHVPVSLGNIESHKGLDSTVGMSFHAGLGHRVMCSSFGACKTTEF